MATRRGILSTVLVNIFLFAVTESQADFKPLKPLDHYSEIASLVAKELPKSHLTRMPLDDIIANRAFDIYFDHLDPYHIYFLESDMAEFEKVKTQMDDNLAAGNVKLAYDAYNLMTQRVTNRIAYVSALIDKGFDIKKDETYEWDRKSAPWPKDQKEWDEIWRKRIKNQYIQELLLDENKALDKKNEEKENKEDKKEDKKDKKKEKPTTPAERILKSYERYETILEEIETDWVLQSYLSAFTMSYDPHCQYMSPASVDNFNIDMKLSLVGIGAVLSSVNGETIVLRILSGGPADRDERDEIKLQAGDKIIKVAQGDDPPEDISNLSLTKVVNKIRGEKGTKVVLTVIASSDPTGETIKKVDLIRDKVKLEERAAKYRIIENENEAGATRKLAVINLPAFYGDMKAAMANEKNYKSSARDIAKILVELKTKNIDGVILDLRNNGGGSLQEANFMTGLFIEFGPVVQINSKERRPRVMGDGDAAIAYAGPLVLLVNRNSASASEILAAALQDYGRAVIVGDSKTLGKGSVQSIIEVGEDSKMGSLKLTTALFFRVSGSSTQLKGVSADVVLPSALDRMDIGEDYLNHALEWRMTREVMFMPFADLVKVVSKLADNSGERIEKSKEFASYIELLDKIDELNDLTELPLHIDKRRDLSKQRKKLNELRKSVIKKKKNEDEKEDPPDIILSEALNILSDLISIHPKVNPRPGAETMTPRIIKEAEDYEQ